MRLFKRSSASPPQLLRLSVLEEGGEANPSTAAPGLRLSLPSCFSECNIDELMAYTETRKLEERSSSRRNAIALSIVENMLTPAYFACVRAGDHLLAWFSSHVPSFLTQFRDAVSDLPICCQVIYSQFGLAIHQNDHQARRRFVEWAQNEIAVVPDFHKRILFSDEAHFWLNGYVNKQNGRIWSEANPQVYVETPLHPEKLTVWCALWAGLILLQKR
ncbi:PDZ domain-containing protein [Trichonephila clavipes]|nr:PDZ domain-containing protein [Trichonephila clavipes]